MFCRQDIAISIFQKPFLQFFGNPDEKRSDLLIGVLGLKHKDLTISNPISSVYWFVLRW